MGFFTKSELKRTTHVKVDVDSLQPNCPKCKLYKDCMSPKMKVSGEGRKKILVIGEMPGRKDDDYGVQFVGDDGAYLKDDLRDIGISLTRDCWKINAVNCRPMNDRGQTRPPSHTEIKCCYPYVEQTIKKLKPKVIVLLGPLAITSLFGKDFSNRKAIRWRNFQIPDEKFGCFVVPLFGQRFVFEDQKNKNLTELFFRDLKTINKCLKREYIPQINHEQNVEMVKDFKSVVSLLKRVIRKKPRIAFDYESTGLKPYRAGHKIVTIAFAVSTEKAYAFPYEYRSFWSKNELSQIKKLWRKILNDPKIHKILHNLKFEDVWSKVMFGTRISSAKWDSMIAQKILDNRGGASGLKFQVFVRYGIRPYDESIGPFLKLKNGEFNEVEKAPLKDLLVYNGLDCIFTYMLYRDQSKILRKMKGLLSAYNFFMRGIRTMGTLQLNGISVNQELYEEADKDLGIKIAERKKYLNDGREASQFKKQFGRSINVNSNADLGKLFFEVLGKKPIYTGKGNYKTDKATLETLNLPFVDKLLEMKKYEKVRGTYLAQFKREVCYGRIHPFFDLHIPVSYRSSSSMPNF